MWRIITLPFVLKKAGVEIETDRQSGKLHHLCICSAHNWAIEHLYWACLLQTVLIAHFCFPLPPVFVLLNELFQKLCHVCERCWAADANWNSSFMPLAFWNLLCPSWLAFLHWLGKRAYHWSERLPLGTRDYHWVGETRMKTLHGGFWF